MLQLLSQASATDLATDLEVKFLSAAGLVSIITAIMLLLRLSRHKPLLSYQPRRPVPWGGWMVLALIAFHILASRVLFLGVLQPLLATRPMAEAAVVLGESAETIDTDPSPAEDTTPEKPSNKTDAHDASHDVVKLFRHGSPWIIAFCCFSTFLITPIAEEFLFRLVLQGWVEKVEHRSRNYVRGEMRTIGRIRHVGDDPNAGLGLPRLLLRVPRGLFSILSVSAMFAMLHFRAAGNEYEVDFLAMAIIASALANVLTVVVGIVALRMHGATAADLGWQPSLLPRDIRDGVITFLLIAGPIYLLQKLLLTLLAQPWMIELLGTRVAPDPITILVFSLALGFLYFRTHRLAASVTLHMALNGTTLLMMLLGGVP